MGGEEHRQPHRRVSKINKRRGIKPRHFLRSCMKERPILMSAAMVRATLDGSKTQTQRIVKPQPAMYEPGQCVGVSDMINDALVCQYGQPGDRLWVRETWRTTGDGGRADYLAPRDLQPHPVWYDSDGSAPADQCAGKTRVSIHMPRWASRILLEIVSVRVERLNDISQDDARAEGISDAGCINCGESERDCDCSMPMPDACESFIRLWQSINGHDSWSANPWVWVIEFKLVTP